MRNLIKQRMWKCLIVSAVLFCLAAPLPAGAAVCVQPPSGMVSWWGGDNNALDMIGTNNGTLVNGATYAAGNVGQAFSFDGTNDYVEMTGSSVGDFGSAPFTVDFWMYAASDPTSNAYLIGKSCPNCGAGWDLRFDNSTISVVGVNGWSVNFWSNPSVTVGAWHHIALAATGSSITLYIDGAVSASNPRSAISSTVSPFRIGDNPDYGGSAFNGLVDEVEIFDRALSLAEIQAIYNAGTAGKCRSCTPPPSGMISWWGGDNNGLDMVGTSNGTLVNGATYASGKVGQAFSLDGVNDYIEMTGSSVGDFGSAPFTVDFWMYAASDPTAHAYLLGKSCPDCGNGWDLRFDNNTIWVVGANGWTYFSSNPSVTVGAWHHIALAATGSSITLYIDGAENVSNPRSGISTTVAPFRIGYTTAYGGTAFNGLIDEVEIFGRALSLAEIQAIYNAGTAGKCRSCTPPPSGMVSWWGGNNNSLDMIGTNNGTVNGATYAAGKVGQAFSLDGNDYIQIPKVSTWDFGTSSFSIDAWFKSGTAGPSGMYRPIIWYDNALSGGYWGVYFNPEGKVEFHIGPASRAGYGVITTNLYNDDNWHFVSAVRDSANGKLKLYIDGHPAASDVSEPGVNIVGAGDAYPSIGRLGSFSGYSGYYFTGLLDEVEIFSRALSASEIAAIYNAGSAGKCAPDTTPDPFPFDPVTGAARSTLYTSNTITISGINVPAEVTITGGEYSVGCTATFINTESTVVNGDTVCVRQTSSPNYSTPTTATLTIGEGSGDFNVTTMASHMLHAEAVPSAAKTFNPSSWEIGQGGNIGIDIEPNAAYYFVSATDNCGAGGAKIGAPNAGNTSYDISPVTADCTLTVTYAAYPVWRDGTTSYFMTMGAGYGDGSAAYTIKAHGVELTDSDLNLSGTAAVVLDGGYLADFSDYSGVPTTITGPFTIGGDGSITIKNIAVK